MKRCLISIDNIVKRLPLAWFDLICCIDHFSAKNVNIYLTLCVIWKLWITIGIHANILSQQQILLFTIASKGVHKRCASWLEGWCSGFENIWTFWACIFCLFFYCIWPCLFLLANMQISSVHLGNYTPVCITSENSWTGANSPRANRHAGQHKRVRIKVRIKIRVRFGVGA